MPGFSLKMHQIQFRLRLCPDPKLDFGKKEGEREEKGKGKGVINLFHEAEGVDAGSGSCGFLLE